MLKKIRKHMKLIMWFILISFILWGAGTSFTAKKLKGQSPANCAGIIFGKKVSFDEYANALKTVEIQSMLTYGENYQKLRQVLDLKAIAWNNLILFKEAKAQGVTVSNKEVVANISGFNFFQRAGQFDFNIYKMMLEQVFRVNATEFEGAIKQLLVIMKLENNALSKVIVTDQEVLDDYKKLNESRKVAYFLFNEKDYLDSALITEKELQDYYNAHLKDLELPDRINIEYMGIDYSDFKDKVVIADEQVQNFYEQNKSKFEKPVEGKPNELSPLTDEIKNQIKTYLFNKDAKKELQAIMNKVFNDLVESDNFSATAAKFSLPIKETGFFSSEVTPAPVNLEAEFIKAASELKKDQTSGIIYTSKGAYILKFKDKSPAHTPTFDEIKDTAKERLAQEQANVKANNLAENTLNQLNDLLKEGVSFNEAVAKLNLKLEISDYFTRSNYPTVIGYSSQFMDEVFKMNPGDISGVVKTQNGYCIIRLDDIKPADLAAFEKEKENFKQFLLGQKQQKALSEFIKEVKQKAGLINYIE